jgi:hypothetical protein
MAEAETVKIENKIDGTVKDEGDNKDNNKDKDRTIETETDVKDDCSDLTDNNEDGGEEAPKSFPQKVSNRILINITFIYCEPLFVELSLPSLSVRRSEDDLLDVLRQQYVTVERQYLNTVGFHLQ